MQASSCQQYSNLLNSKQQNIKQTEVSQTSNNHTNREPATIYTINQANHINAETAKPNPQQNI
jgi:hypothetical protein